MSYQHLGDYLLTLVISAGIEPCVISTSLEAIGLKNLSTHFSDFCWNTIHKKSDFILFPCFNELARSTLVRVEALRHVIKLHWVPFIFTIAVGQNAF